MKVLLDENLPHRLRALLPGHECFTVAYMGWNGIENGQLLQLAAKNGFQALITTDRDLEYEQSSAQRPLAIIVLLTPDNKLKTIERLAPRIIEALCSLTSNALIKVQ